MARLDLSVFNNKHVKMLAGNAFTSVIGVVTGALLTHNLSVSDAGIWWVVLSFETFCEAARYGLLATTTVKFYAGAEPERARAVIGSIWVLALALSAIIMLGNGVLYLAFRDTHDMQLFLCIKWVGVTYLSTLPADVAFWKLQADQKYGTYFWFRMLNSGTTILVFIVLALLHRLTLGNALLFNFLTNCLASSVGLLFNMTGLKNIVYRTGSCIKELLNFGKYTLLTTGSSVLLTNSDIWIIDFMLGSSAVAIYAVASRLMQILDLPLRSVVTTGMSEMALHHNQGNKHQVTYIFKKYTGMLTIGFIPIIILTILFGYIGIYLYGGAQYSGTIAPVLLSLLMAIAITYPLDRFNGLALDITNKARINSYKVFLMLVVKVITAFGTILLIKYLVGHYMLTGKYASQLPILGLPCSLLLATLAGIMFGHYHLRKDLDYTIRDIFIMGFDETKSTIYKIMNIKSSR